MAFLREMLRIELATLVACFGVAIVWKIVRGMLRPAGRMILGRLLGGGVAGLLRLQLLAASLVFALVYLASSLRSAGSGALPPVPNYVLTLMSGSQAVFLGAAVGASRAYLGLLETRERSKWTISGKTLSGQPSCWSDCALS